MSEQFGIVGNSFATDLPQAEIEKQLLAEEKSKAKFSRTKEFTALKQHLNERMDYYKAFLPDGRPVVGANVTPEDWKIANTIIGEFQAVINAYEQAAEAVKDVKQIR